jgi:transcriptional regulator with XRE-family HTH domain
MAVTRTVGEVFGERLRELRQKRGWTQVELAQRCDLPQARISELESGGRAPNLVTMIRLASALECLGALVSVFDKEDLAKLLPK